jgi:HAD superfamily hydrolase (TIGR01509 family)
MSGGLFVRALMRELGHDLDPETARRVRVLHDDGYLRRLASVRPLPGARELLGTLSVAGIPWAVATSGTATTASRSLELLPVPESVPVVTRDQVAYAKPNPDLFLAAARRLGVAPSEAMIVGDSVWDLLAAHRAGSLGIGVLSGGYGRDELQGAGAYRVYDDPADLLAHLDELGIRDVAQAPAALRGGAEG